MNERKDAVDRIDYYCRNTDYLSDIKKVLIDGNYSGENLLMLLRKFPRTNIVAVKLERIVAL